MVFVAAAAWAMSCSGEIGSGNDGQSDDAMTDVGADVSADTDAEMDTTPTEPDFGPITVTPEMCADAPTSAGVAPMRLLTRAEYDRTIRDLLGAAPVADSFPPENLVDGFENNAYVHTVSPLLVRSYMEGAEAVAADVVSRRLDTLLPCDPAVVGQQACANAFIAEILPRAFRRPVHAEERTAFEELARVAIEAPELTYEDAIEMLLEAILQSPQFLYRMELQEGRPDGDLVAANGWEVASRLSYFLWGTMPDEELFQAASDGTLETREGVAAQARRMLDDPKADAAVRAFYRQWLSLTTLSSMAKDSGFYPGWDVEMNDDWHASMLAFVSFVYGSEGTGTLEQLLTSPDVFMTPELAGLYGVSQPEAGMTRYTFDPAERAGLLTQPALMAILANANQGSPVRRGVFVREKLLCQKLPPPPADLAVEPPDPDPNATTRERFRQHTEDELCASCHQLIDPVGFGFEYYDGVGAYRETENGKPVDASGNVINAPPEVEGEFVGGVELAQRLAQSEEVEACVAETWFRYGMGRQFGDDDACNAYEVQRAFNESGGDLEELMIAIATSDSFRYRTEQVRPDPDGTRQGQE